MGGGPSTRMGDGGRLGHVHVGAEQGVGGGRNDGEGSLQVGAGWDGVGLSDPAPPAPKLWGSHPTRI